jgi:hypothetical protein
MRCKLNVGQAAWMKEVVYERPEIAPGIEGKLTIRPVEVPQVERKIPYHVDILLQTSIVLDSKNRPTNKHRITLTGGRRPRSISPEDFHVGKRWTFDSKNPVDPWETIIQPLIEKWDDGAVDFLGMDEKAINGEEKDIDKVTQDYTMGCMISLIQAQTDFQVYRDRVWTNEIAPIIDELDEEHKKTVLEAHDKKKKELGG